MSPGLLPEGLHRFRFLFLKILTFFILPYAKVPCRRAKSAMRIMNVPAAVGFGFIGVAISGLIWNMTPRLLP